MEGIGIEKTQRFNIFSGNQTVIVQDNHTPKQTGQFRYRRMLPNGDCLMTVKHDEAAKAVEVLVDHHKIISYRKSLLGQGYIGPIYGCAPPTSTHAGGYMSRLALLRRVRSLGNNGAIESMVKMEVCAGEYCYKLGKQGGAGGSGGADTSGSTKGLSSVCFELLDTRDNEVHDGAENNGSFDKGKSRLDALCSYGAHMVYARRNYCRRSIKPCQNAAGISLLDGTQFIHNPATTNMPYRFFIYDLPFTGNGLFLLMHHPLKEPRPRANLAFIVIFVAVEIHMALPNVAAAQLQQFEVLALQRTATTCSRPTREQLDVSHRGRPKRLHSPANTPTYSGRALPHTTCLRGACLYPSALSTGLECPCLMDITGPASSAQQNAPGAIFNLLQVAKVLGSVRTSSANTRTTAAATATAPPASPYPSPTPSSHTSNATAPAQSNLPSNAMMSGLAAPDNAHHSETSPRPQVPPFLRDWHPLWYDLVREMLNRASRSRTSSAAPYGPI
ncbi:hypothetical protein VE03_07907 [Pseudogymnoascus sp. 23342-1-I1]|nr:hypothetical protein VE03_07907 [Pseudogymnoascus sp. 23342-1-I1]